MAKRTFAQRLGDVIRSASSMRDNLQALLIEAQNHAAGNNDDFVYLTMITNRCIGVKALNTSQLQAFIKAHVSNIQWSKRKDGSYGWIKAKKGVPCEYQEMTSNWYDYEVPGATKPEPYNVEKFRTTLKRAATRLAREAGVSVNEIADELAHMSADLQRGEIEIRLDKTA